jgi:hypothetical protein
MSEIASLDEARARAKTKPTEVRQTFLPPLTTNERIDTLTETVEFAYETILDLLGRIEALEEKTRLFEPEGARP